MSRFQTTRWSLIEAIHGHPSHARAALEQLCRAYRPPVLAFVRHSGHGPADAEDLTQAFFLHFVESGWYAKADPQRGRFRSLLLASLRHFLSNEREHAAALKRGGAYISTNDMLESLQDDGDSPEQAFTRAWIGTVLARAMAKLQGEWERAGKRTQFEQLAPLIERADVAEIKARAEATGQRSNTVAVQAHRMRRRLRELVQLELLQTVSTREALDQEMAELGRVLDDVA